jgi:hypothetical protein
MKPKKKDRLLELFFLLVGLICVNWFFISIEELWIKLLVFVFGSVCLYGFIDLVSEEKE